MTAPWLDKQERCSGPLINDFNQRYLNPYLNFHRPCFFPETPSMTLVNNARPTATRR